jgi:hypothetical protein
MVGRDSVQLHEHMDPASLALPDPTTCVDPRNHIHSPPPLPSILIHSPSPLLPLPLSVAAAEGGTDAAWRCRPGTSAALQNSNHLARFAGLDALPLQLVVEVPRLMRPRLGPLGPGLVPDGVTQAWRQVQVGVALFGRLRLRLRCCERGTAYTVVEALPHGATRCFGGKSLPYLYLYLSLISHNFWFDP